jgi:AraC-like DNA-binding protein
MDYSADIHNTISYIEQHLCDNLTLDGLAKTIGFSKYHFIRIFKLETGSNLWEHIQSRRLAQAARLLLYTDCDIIGIAIKYRFESQEAFTRAFKREYSIPPGRFRRTIGDLIRLEETTHMTINNLIPGWLVTGTFPKAYNAFLDRNVFYKGTKSIHLTSVNKDLGTSDYCTVLQQFKAKNYIGKRIRFSAFIKSENVEGWGGLWMRINNTTASIIKIDNMQNRPIRGTNDWNYYAVVLDVPDTSAIINIGILLYGTGTLWINNTNFEIVDNSIRTTDVDLSCDLPDAPVNLSLEEV